MQKLPVRVASFVNLPILPFGGKTKKVQKPKTDFKGRLGALRQKLPKLRNG